MHFHFALDAADSRQWLLELARILQGEGHDVSFEVRSGPVPSDTALSLLLACERRLYHLQGACPFTPLDPALLPTVQAAPDHRFELSRSGAEGLTLHVGETAGVASLPDTLMARAPLPLSFRAPDGSCAAQGVPALSDPDSLWRCLVEATGRIAALALMAVDGHGAQRPVLALPPAGKGVSTLRFFLGSFWRKSRARLFPDRFRQEHWRVGIRARHFNHLGEEALGLEGFTWVPEDGSLFYADPVLFEHEGRTFLFMEEYSYDNPRGMIAYTEVLPSGEIAFAPRVIIERERHLSFPLIFEHEGAIYMAPENFAEGHVPLYRARRFPETWEEMPPLLKAPLHDATLMTLDGRYWILGNIALHEGSSCDVMVAYCADAPLGPYEPHAANPLLLDARFTRAGGDLIEEDGVPLRVVQDCCTGYGQFLRFASIEGNGAGGLRFNCSGRWQPPPGIAGLHSYTRSTRFEAIDIRAALRQQI